MVRIVDSVKTFRDKICHMFRGYLESCNISSDKISDLANYINDNDSLFYKNIVTIGYLDFFKLHLQSIVDMMSTVEEEEELSFLEKSINSVDDLICYSLEDDNFLDLVKSIIRFNDLDDVSKREMITTASLKEKYLKNISYLHLVDKLYYAFPYKLEDFLELCEEENSSNYKLCKKSLWEFSDIIGNLFFADPKNYSEIISGLIDNYKVMKYNGIKNDDELEKVLEQEEIQIYNICFTNISLRIRLLSYYLEFNRLLNKDEQEKCKKKVNEKREKYD